MVKSGNRDDGCLVCQPTLPFVTSVSSYSVGQSMHRREDPVHGDQGRGPCSCGGVFLTPVLVEILCVVRDLVSLHRILHRIILSYGLQNCDHAESTFALRGLGDDERVQDSWRSRGVKTAVPCLRGRHGNDRRDRSV